MHVNKREKMLHLHNLKRIFFQYEALRKSYYIF